MKFKLTPITLITKKHYSGLLHDLTVEKNHSYNINNHIVHNSICSTRINTAFGVPQYTALMDCAEYKNKNVILIADGGIKNSGDIVKAMKAGADCCMVGKLLAGTDLALGQCYNKYKETTDLNSGDIKYRAYRGMASREARGSVLSYASVEGVSGLVPFTGSTEQLLIDIELNLKAALSYAGCYNWEEFRKFTKVIEISNNSTIENQTHIE